MMMTQRKYAYKKSTDIYDNKTESVWDMNKNVMSGKPQKF
jgi:hypothetical protein